MCVENLLCIFQCPSCAMFIHDDWGEWDRCAVQKYALNIYCALSNFLTFPSLLFSLTSPLFSAPSSFSCFTFLPPFLSLRLYAKGSVSE